MAEIEKPIAVSLHGPVHGAGVGLTLASDPRVAAESTTLSVAFVKIGLIPDAGVTFFLPRVVGLGKAMEMSMLGESVDAEEAHRIGLVNRVFTDEKLEEETRTLAGRLAGMPPMALNRIKQVLYASLDRSPDRPRKGGCEPDVVRLHAGPQRGRGSVLREARGGLCRKLKSSARWTRDVGVLVRRTPRIPPLPEIGTPPEVERRR